MVGVVKTTISFNFVLYHSSQSSHWWSVLLVYKHLGKESLSGNVPPCCQSTNMGCRRRFKHYLKDLMVNPVEGGKLLSDLTHSWWASVPDPLVGGGQVGGGKASFQGDFFLSSPFYSSVCVSWFWFSILILIFIFFHPGGASTGSLHPQVIVAHYDDLQPIWIFALIDMGQEKKRVSVLIWWSV